MQSTHGERWLPIPGYEGSYEVSDQGRVKSLDRVIIRSNGSRARHRGRIMSPGSLKSGHLIVGLSGKTHRIHRLVLENFVGPCPAGMEACHNNGDPTDNRVENLRWDTHSENMHDRVSHGTDHYANRTHCKNGHEFQGENLIIRSDSGRGCRTCATAHAERVRRKKGIKPAGLKSHCNHGHEYTDENTYTSPSGIRTCRACIRRRAREYRARKALNGDHR